ncbi:outer membrane protein assembly factor BamD [Bernardetia sp.]|uniref:outer membrane protein assembly factor BamD n=1 Tax=Bernardetia sp. TaxID=1937974 RepID=UPI0025B9B9DF|nr:outer membrane protein assembly factor BamD [Bernardetia sp.]
MKNIQLIVVLLCAVLGTGVFSSCSKFTKAMSDPNWRVRDKAAQKYYEEGDYYRAGLLWEDVVPIVKGDPRAEDIQFKYAYCHFYQKQYLLAAYYFKNFYFTYRRSPNAVEAYFMNAFSLYKDSPRTHLDQESTKEAIQAFQDVINTYPDTDYAKRASKHLDELRAKLELKAFENAELFYNLGRYKAAVIALENFQKDYPDAPQLPEAAYLRLKSEYDLAKNSIYSKQKERYEISKTYYFYLIDRYPESKFAKDAENIYDNIEKALRNIEKGEIIDTKEKKDPKKITTSEGSAGESE